MNRRIQSYIRKISLLVIVGLIIQGIEGILVEQQFVSVSNNNRSEYLGLKLYKGHLHSHTSISDGIGYPHDAYEYVKQHTDLDFFSVTEHEVTFEISNGNDYLTDYTESYSQDFLMMHEQSNAHNADHEFVTIPGVEVTWYDMAGHINLFHTSWFPRSYPKGGAGNVWTEGGNLMYDLPTFYARLSQDTNALAQFNHPSAARHGNFFGFKHFNPDVDQMMALFEYRYSENYPNILKILCWPWIEDGMFRRLTVEMNITEDGGMSVLM